MVYVELDEIKAIFSSTLQQGVMFDIISFVIYLLHLKDVFACWFIDDSIMHLTNFIGICTSYAIPRVD